MVSTLLSWAPLIQVLLKPEVNPVHLVTILLFSVKLVESQLRGISAQTDYAAAWDVGPCGNN